jgi:prepilin-type N-terminal cleavage/methylation domain-containing protein
MKNPANRRTQGGFTIVEVLIVLAIAGFILLLALEAIPTLVRNSRNDQRKQDVALILEAASHYELNNSGNFPGNTSNFLQYSKLNFYNQAAINYGSLPASGVGVYSYANAAASPVAGPVGALSIDNTEILNYQKCDATSPGSSTRQGAGYSDVVGLYKIETSSGSVNHCEQL